jgi:membrane-bound serine protease (ClpP class)
MAFLEASMASARKFTSLPFRNPAASLRLSRRGVYLFAWLLALLLILAAPATGAAPAQVLTLQGAIGPASADYLVRGMQRAESSGAPLVVIALDTPGGLDSSMRQIIQAVLASRVPVAVYVHPEGARAASAGTYLLYAAHIAAMAPATTLGAATPVAIGLPGMNPGQRGKEDKPGAPPSAGQTDPMTAKQVNDAAAFIRGLAQLRGRNADWAERAVRNPATLTASEALRDKVIDVVAKDLPDLLSQIDGRTVRVQAADIKLATWGLIPEMRPPDRRQRLLSVLANPALALILLMIGIYGLIFEFSSPGVGLAGTAGAICLLLALFALQMLPVNYAGLALIGLGLVLLVAELLAPAFGAWGAAGVVAFIAGGLLLFDRDAPGLGVPLVLVLALAATSAAVILLGGGMALKARQRPVLGGLGGLAGASGEVLEVNEGEIWAQVQGERWRVCSQHPLEPGQRIRVLGLRGLTLEVQIEAQAEAQKIPQEKTQGERHEQQF